MARVLLVLLFVWRATAAEAEQSSQQGRSLFGEQCAACHGADGRGLNGPSLTNLFTASGSEARVHNIIRNGVPGSIMHVVIASGTTLLSFTLPDR